MIALECNPGKREKKASKKRTHEQMMLDSHDIESVNLDEMLDPEGAKQDMIRKLRQDVAYGLPRYLLLTYFKVLFVSFLNVFQQLLTLQRYSNEMAIMPRS